MPHWIVRLRPIFAASAPMGMYETMAPAVATSRHVDAPPRPSPMTASTYLVNHVVTPLYPMNHSEMESSRNARLRLTGAGRTSWPAPSSVARFHSGWAASSFRFSSPSFGSRMVRYKIATAVTMIIETMKNSGR